MHTGATPDEQEGVYDAYQYEFSRRPAINLLLGGFGFFSPYCITHKTTRTESNPLRGSNTDLLLWPLASASSISIAVP